MLLILYPGEKLIIQDQVSGRVAYALLFGLRAVKFMLLILPSGGKLIMSEWIAYAPLFGLSCILACFFSAPDSSSMFGSLEISFCLFINVRAEHYTGPSAGRITDAAIFSPDRYPCVSLVNPLLFCYM